MAGPESSYGGDAEVWDGYGMWEVPGRRRCWAVTGNVHFDSLALREEAVALGDMCYYAQEEPICDQWPVGALDSDHEQVKT